jgi:hypothetical protein
VPAGDPTGGLAAGIAAADAVCQDDAQSKGLPGTYRAFLATSAASAISRFDTSAAPWVRVDGIPIVHAASDLGRSKGRFVAPLQVTAAGGNLLNHAAWTGSGDPGAPGNLGSTCNDWRSAANSSSGTAGTVQFSAFSQVSARARRTLATRRTRISTACSCEHARRSRG